MRIVLDENISGDTEMFLRTHRHETSRAPAGADDRAVLALAEMKQAILLTRDHDFLNFVPSSLSGIIFVRIHPSIAEHITQAVGRLLAEVTEEALYGKVIILRADGYEVFR